MINARLDLFKHSPTGFEWSYDGSGPAQLALAILADYFGDKDALAVDLHQDFKRDVVAKFPKEGWQLTAAEIENWLAKRRGESPKLRCPLCGAPDAIDVLSYTMLNVNTPLRLRFNANGSATGVDITTATDEGIPFGDFADVLCQCRRCNAHLQIYEIMESHK
jgi:hypothetical protein